MDLAATLMMHILIGWAALLVTGFVVCGLWLGLKRLLRIHFPPTGQIPEKYWVVPRN